MQNGLTTHQNKKKANRAYDNADKPQTGGEKVRWRMVHAVKRGSERESGIHDDFQWMCCACAPSLLHLISLMNPKSSTNWLLIEIESSNCTVGCMNFFVCFVLCKRAWVCVDIINVTFVKRAIDMRACLIVVLGCCECDPTTLKQVRASKRSNNRWNKSIMGIEAQFYLRAETATSIKSCVLLKCKIDKHSLICCQ